MLLKGSFKGLPAPRREAFIDIKKLQQDVSLNPDDLRDVLAMFGMRMKTVDLIYTVNMLATEIERRSYDAPLNFEGNYAY